MKLPVAKNKILIISLLILCYSTGFELHKPTPVIGKWQYRNVTKNDTALWKIGDSDTMFISSTGIFLYDLEFANKHATGTWKPISAPGNEDAYQALEFHYSDGKIRTFEICYCSEDSLCLKEGALKFLYSRRK